MKPRYSNLSNSTHFLAAIGLLCLLTSDFTARAQTNTLAPSQNFFETAKDYFTSANTNYTWTSNTLEMAVGADYMSSVNWANYVDAQYDIGRFAIEAKMRNAGIAGTVDSAEGGVGFALVEYYSVKLEAGIDGGYDLDRNTGLIEPKLTLRDKLTPKYFPGSGYKSSDMGERQADQYGSGHWDRDGVYVLKQAEPRHTW